MILNLSYEVSATDKKISQNVSKILQKQFAESAKQLYEIIKKEWKKGNHNIKLQITLRS